VLTLTPVSNDFVISDSLVFYPCTGDYCPRTSDNVGTPGVHDLSNVVATIEDAVKQRDDQRRISPDGDWISEQWLPEAYPILVRLYYVYEGQTIEVHQLYIVVYRDPTSMSFNRHENSPERKSQSVKLERAYFLERVPGNEKPLQALEKEFRNWRRFVDTGPAYP